MNSNTQTAFPLILLFPILLSAQVMPNQMEWIIEKEKYKIHYSENDEAVQNIQKYVDSGIRLATSSLQKEFKSKIDVYLFPDRSLLDKQWQSEWNMPSFQSECWMVGSGVESRLDLLSPSVWDKQACDHDPNNQTEIELLVSHELVHILHSDYNISPSFGDINNIDWFVEGLATFISGQYDSVRLTRTIEHLKVTGGPEKLSMLWKGDHKYGLSGSMISYIDAKYGREMLSDLLVHNDVNDILKKLDVTEDELIEGWKEVVLDEK